MEGDVDLEAVERSLLAAVEEQLGGYAIAVEEKAQIARGFKLGRVARMQGEARARALEELAGLRVDAGSEAEEFLRGRQAVAAVSGAELQAVRELHFGVEAAERLAALDGQRAAWVGGSRHCGASGRRCGVGLRGRRRRSRLRSGRSSGERRDFSPEEPRRVRALERLGR